MSRLTRDSSSRRASLLATTTFVAASVLGGMGAMTLSLAPSIAFANSECSPAGGTAPGIVTCQPNTYATGITYTGAGSGGKNIVNNGNTTLLLDSDAVTDGGVSLTATTGVALAADTVLQTAVSPITNVNNSAGNGIFVSSGGGDVSVSTVDTLIGGVTVDDVANTISGGYGSGIRTATTGAGKTTINIGADSINASSGSTADGAVRTAAGTGTTTITILKGATLHGDVNSFDLTAVSTGGAININSDGAENHVGTNVSSGGGAIGVTIGPDGSSTNVGTGFGAGIDSGLITSSGAGLTTLTINGNVSGTGVDGDGIFSTSAGGITINTAKATTVSSTNVTGISLVGSGGAITGTIAGNVTGDYAMTATQTGAGTINLTYGGAVTGTNGGLSQSTQAGANQANLTGTAVVKSTGTTGTNAAVNLTSTSGPITINSDATTDVESLAAGGSNGVFASSTAGGGITVALKGSVGGTSAVTGEGVVETTTGGAGNISSNTALILSNGNALDVNNKGSGTNSVTVNGATNSNNANGVLSATKAGANTVTVAAGGSVTASGGGIIASGTGGGLVSVIDTAGGGIQAGLGDGINATNSSTGGVLVETAGTGTVLSATGNGIVASDTSILASAGAVNVGTASARISANVTATSAGKDGIKASGGGNVSVFTGAATIAGNNATGFGISAIAGPSLDTTAKVVVDAAGTTITGGTGILAQNKNILGGNTVTVNTDATTSITSAAGDGIEALGITGTTTVLNNGAISATGGDGIDANNHLGGNLATGNVDVNGAGAITVVTGGATGGNGIQVRSDLGNLTVGDLGGGYAGTIDNKDGANGIDAQITVATSAGNINITTAAGGVIGAGALDSTTDGINATTVGLGSVTVTDNGNIGSLTNNRVLGIGVNATITNTKNNSNVLVTVGGATNIDSIGDGVSASTNAHGNVTVTQNVGTGTINSSLGVGISAVSTGDATGFGNVTVNQNAKVTTLSGTAVVATSSTNGDVAVNQGVGAVISATGGDGIDASNTSNLDGNVTADLNGSTTATGIGVFATTNTNDDVTVTLETGSAVTGGSAGAANDGVLATDTGGPTKSGLVTVSLLGNAEVGTGTAARTGGNGVEVNSAGPGQIEVDTAAATNIFSVGTGILADENYDVATKHSADLVITAHGSIDSSNGLGIDAEVTKATNNASVLVTAGNIKSKQDGVLAKTIGGGNVTVTTDAGTAIASSTANGIEARSLGGNGNVLVTNNGTVSGDPGIVISAVGTGTATEIANASVTGTLDAVNITSVDGLLTVQVNNAGTVVSSTASGDGINATTTGKGSISITTGTGTTVEGGTSTATAGATDGIFANVGGTGTITVEAAGAVGTKAPTVSWGIQAVGNGGLVQVTLDPSGSVSDGGILATNTTANNGNVNVTLNGASTVTNSAAARDGVDAFVNNGLANVQAGANTSIITVGNGISAVANTSGGTVVVSDLGHIGVAIDAINASTVDGNINVTTGAGTIGGSLGINTSVTSGAGTTTITTGTGLVSGNGGGVNKDGIHSVTGGSGLIKITTGPVSSTNGNGIFAQSTTGAANIQIDTSNGAINGGSSGITADNHLGVGSILITSAAVTSTAGPGINDTAGTGGTTVNANGNVTSTGGAAINATSAFGGKTQVITGTGAVVLSNSGGVGINAASGSGAVVVTTNNTVTGATSGITSSTGGAGTINVDTTAGGLVKGNAGDGIDATASTGSILIQTAAVTGTVNGISALGNTSSPITITTNGAITGGTGAGIKAVTALTGPIQINVLTGAVSGAVGISTAQTGSGVTNIVDGLAANTITGTNGDGIQSVNGAGTGAVNVGGGKGQRIEAAVHGTTNGIDISGAGAMNVFTDAAVTGDNGWGIKAVSTAAPVTVDVAGGTIQGTGKGGILAKSSAAGAGAVTVTSTTTIIGKGAGSNGIDAEDTVAGDVSVADTGPSVTGVNDAIFASSVGGKITVGTVAAPITSTIGDATTTNVGIETNNTTGTTTINTAASATINDPNANGGILANSTTGGITINSASAITAKTVGIAAVSVGANATGIAIVNTGAITMGGTGTFTSGVVGVPIATYGIVGVSAGTGLVTVTNSGVIDPAAYGIYMQGAGPVNITNTANVTATITALTAKSTGGGIVTVTSNGAATTLTGTNGDGIDAFSAGAGNGSVTVGVSNAAPITSNIIAGVNGVDAEGNGVVGVWTSGTITGTSGIGVIAKSTSGAVAGSTVTVSTTGDISDKAGILASTTGTNGGDSVTVTAANNITTTNGIGIEADGVNGLVSVAYNAGTIKAVNGDGIHATSTGAGGILVTTALGTEVEGNSAGKNDISAIDTGASGDINITVSGTLSAVGPNAGNDAIFAQVNNAVSTSNINVTTVQGAGLGGSIWGNGDGVEATTNGLGAITVNTAGLVTFGGAFGISATATNALDTKNVTVGVTGAGQVDGAGVGDAAILATTAGTGNVNVTVANGETLEGANGSGIIAKNTGTAGSVTVNVGTSTVGGGAIGTGVFPTAVDGILAQITNAANNSTVTVTNNAAITMANGSDAGIKAISAGTGTVTITNTGVIDPAAFGQFGSGAGNVNVFNSGNTTGLVGIHGDTSGAAPFTVTVNDTGGATVTGTTGNGIEAFGTGGGNVTVNTTAGGTISGGTNGIDTVITGGTGATNVNTLTGGTATAIQVVGNGGDGIRSISSSTGAINITAGNVLGQGGAGHSSNGIFASSTGGGTITVATTGNVTGDTVGNATVVGANGIKATTTGGNGNVSVTVSAPSLPVGTTAAIQGGNNGIFASSTGTGSTTILVNALTPVTATATGTAAAPSTTNAGAGPVGIDAIGGTGGGVLGKANGVSVTVNSNVTAAGGRAIVTNTQNNAAITIASGVTVKGLGDSVTAFGGPKADTATHAVVDVSGVSGGVTTLNNNGTITSVNGPAIASYGDLAILGATTGPASKVATGGDTVNNSATGTILGRVQFGGLTTADNLIVNNSGVWHSTGLDTLGSVANSETITNKSGGVIGLAANSVATTLAFGSGTNLQNTITNAAGGVIIDGEAPAGGVKSGTPATPAVTTITGQVTFNNNGLLIMGNAGGSTTASDGLIDSVLQAGGGTTLGGTGVIALDANLWSDTQSAAGCNTNTLTAADCLVVANSAGNEGLRVTDTKAHALGAFNPTGITVVVGAGNAGANFHIDPGSTWFNVGGTNQFGGATSVLAKPGLFFYALDYFAADKTERLVGVPEAAAFEFATVGGATNDLWYATTQTWFDRQADLRDSIDGKGVGSGPGVWLKMSGDFSNRNHNDVFTPAGGNQTFVFNVSYDQNTATIIGGLDLLNVTHKNEAWVLGIDGGYVDSDINFRQSPDHFALSGANVGGYATYMNGGLFIDGTISANLLDMKVSLPQLQTTPNPWTTSDSVRSFGGQVEAGYEMPLGNMLFWEPLGVVSYVNTTFSNLPVPGGTQVLGSDNSFRASLGARVGAMADFQYYKVKVSLTGRVWDEFENNALSTLIVPGGPNFINNDNLKGVFGEISGQANLFTLNSGLSAFLNGGVKFKSAYTEGTVTLGARYQF